MLDVADLHPPLMTLEITSHQERASVFMEIVEKLGYAHDKVQLVANRNDSRRASRRPDVEASLGRKIPHTIVSRRPHARARGEPGRAVVISAPR